MHALLLALYIADAVANLCGCYWHKEKLRGVSKALIIPLLAAFAFSWRAPHPLLIAAFALCWVGDVLLLFHKLFLFGACSFMGAHACFILYFLPSVAGKGLLVREYILTVPVYLMFSTILFGTLRRHIKAKYLAAGAVYGTSVAVMSLFAFLRMYVSPDAGTLSVFCGSVLFVISDSTLFIRTFSPDFFGFKYRYTVVMVSYIGAVTMMALGLFAL